MSRIVSYALFRHGDSDYNYINYVRLIVRAHWMIWRPYQLWFLHDDRVMDLPYFKAMSRMAQHGLMNLYYVGKSEALTKSMLWRVLPAWWAGVEYVICRDTDSVPLPRDRRAVEEFIASGKAVHVIHSSESHAGVMGGTTSIHVPQFRTLINADTWDQYVNRNSSDLNWDVKGADQSHLWRTLYRGGNSDLLLHDLVDYERTPKHNNDVIVPDIRKQISGDMPEDVPKIVGATADIYSRIIGGCVEVEAPYRFFDALEDPVMDKIRECERD